MDGIKIFDTLIPDSDFKLASSSDIGYSNPSMKAVDESEIDNVAEALDTIINVLNTAPTLSYISEEGFREGETKYWKSGETMVLKFHFSSSAAGKCNITVTSGTSSDTYSCNKGSIMIPLGIAEGQNVYKYTVTAIDALGRDAEQTLEFNQVVGGVEISSTFETKMEDIVFTYGVKNENAILSGVIKYAETQYDRYIIYDIINKLTGNSIFDSPREYVCDKNTSLKEWSYNISLADVIFPNMGEYELIVKGKVYISDSHKPESDLLKYNFAVIEPNSIATTIVNNPFANEIDSSNTINILFRTITNTDIKSMTAYCILESIDEDGNTLEEDPKESIIEGIYSGNIKEWRINRLNAGRYKYTIICNPSGGPDASISSIPTTGIFVVKPAIEVGDTYEQNGLVAYFDANDKTNTDLEPNIWKSKGSGSNKYYYFDLYNLNYSTNGWVADDSGDGGTMLKFTGDSYGELKYMNEKNVSSPFSPMSLMDKTATGNTFEIVYKTRCIGQMDACVISCRDESVTNSGGYSIYYNEAKVSSDSQSASTYINESNFDLVHVTFVIDKNIRELKQNGNNGTITNSNIENLNPVPTINIYVNGVRTKVINISDDEIFNTDLFSLVLNGYKDGNNFKGFGSCEIKMIRIYNTALTASQVVNNYINSKNNIDIKTNLLLKNNTEKANIPIVYFVRNKTVTKSQVVKKDENGNPLLDDKGNQIIIDEYDVVYNKYSKDTDFTTLNAIEEKDFENPDLADSKNTWVNCTMWYKYIDKATNKWVTIKYDDVDVYLQGTSSLKYPIKNYKIKVYKWEFDESKGKLVRKKYKFIPPNKTNTEGWLVPDYTYTFKCDYMEQSHKNNTPTAAFYENVLDVVMSDDSSTGSSYSPCKRNTYYDAFKTIEVVDEKGNKTEKSVKKYRDAINGFPILLYYNENSYIDENNIPIDYNDIKYSATTEEYKNLESTIPNFENNEEYKNTISGYHINDNDIMVGSMMYNVDKSGAALGFEPKLEGDKTITITNPVTGEVVKNKNGEVITFDTIPCVSLEGASNTAIPAAASFYTMEEANIYTYNKYLTLEYSTLKNENKISKDKLFDDFYNEVQSGEYEGIYSYNQYKDVPKSGMFTDIYDYVSATFDIRHAWTEDLFEDGIIDENVFNQCTYGHIVNTINWVNEAADNKDKFTKEFSNYFDFAYCATYFLQMMMFIQIDCAGKNAMFDKWFCDDSIMKCGGIRPRPYDMDTQMGLDNIGEDNKIPVSSEINAILSPTEISGKYAHSTEASNINTDSSHSRYTSTYNTPNSKFWNAFATYYKTELTKIYSKLRNNGIYDSDYICSFVNSMTSDIIGESFYNKDASSKYLTQTYRYVEDGIIKTKSDMLSKLNGNRDNRYRQILNQRLIFMDSWYNFKTSAPNIYTTNKIIELRSDAYTLGHTSCYVGISVYSPCYVRISVGEEVNITAYVDPNERYTYGTDEYEGVLFKLPLISINKDIGIYPAGNIKSINHMNDMYLSSIKCGNASKITEININPSDVLKEIETGNNTYLRKLDISGSSNDTNTPNNLTNNDKIIDLSLCSNLKSIDISNTSLKSIKLPEGGALKTFKAKNSLIEKLSFKNLQFLDTINVTNCTNITEFKLDTCPLIKSVNLKNFIKLNTLVIDKCKNIESLNLKQTAIEQSKFSISNCEKINYIDLSSCKSDLMNNLDLSTIYNLKTIDISDSTPEYIDEDTDEIIGVRLKLPGYAYEYSSLTPAKIQELKDNNIDVHWHGLTTLKAENSYLTTICYSDDSNYITNNIKICNFERLNELTSLTLKGSTRINSIENLNYTGSVDELFKDLTSCEKITGNIVSTTNKCEHMFSRCFKLSDFSSLMIDLSTVTHASYGMYCCYKIRYSDIKKVLDSLSNAIDLSYFLYNAGSKNNNIYIEYDMFKNNTKVTNMNGFFRGCYIESIPEKVTNGKYEELLDPMKNTLTSISHLFYQCPVKTVPNNFFKNLSNITKYNYCFCYSKLTTFFTDSYDIFPKENAAKELSGMFWGCTDLTPGDNITGNIKDMFDRLNGVQQIDRIFSACNNLITGPIPEGLLEKCTLLQNIDSMFSRCTGNFVLPERLFNITNKTKTTHTKLTSARGVFSDCINLTGNIRSNFFSGAFNIEDIGHYKCNPLGNSSIPEDTHYGGMFANTAVSGYAHDFLSKLKNLKSVSMLFFKGNIGSSTQPKSDHSNSEALQNIYIGENEYTNAIYNDIFSSLDNLEDVRYAFAGNTKISKVYDKDGIEKEYLSLFSYNCKTNKLKNAEGLFAKCTSLNIELNNELFKDCILLENLRCCFKDCTDITGNIPSDLFTGCSSLNRTDYMFYGCTSLGNETKYNQVCIPSNLFDGCRSSISHVEYMFAKTGLKGMIGTGELEQQGVDDDGNPIYVIKTYGLLSHCTSLASVAGMFADCINLTGAIPKDMFYTSSVYDKYMYLKDISSLFCNCELLGLNSDTHTVNGSNDNIIYRIDGSAPSKTYLVPQDWLNKCPEIDNVSYLFYRVGRNSNSNTSFKNSNNKLQNTLFDKQTNITKANYAFCSTKVKGELNASFMQNSLNTLKQAAYIFAFTSIDKVGNSEAAIFEKKGKNRALTNLTAAFAGMPLKSDSYAPDPDNFLALTDSDGMVFRCNVANISDYTDMQKNKHIDEPGRLNIKLDNVTAIFD